MRIFKHRGNTVFGGLALVAAFALVQVASASAATFPNACKNSVTPNNSQISVTMTANTSPNPVAPGGSVSLTNIDQTANVPGTIFVAGYNLGLLTTGSNTIPAVVQTTIEGTNTVEGTQVTNTPATSVTTTITDPDGSPGTGDETGTDGVINVTYADQTWTAGASGTINFREDTLPISAGGGALHTGGIKITATIAGFLEVRFGCSPGTVAGPDPGVVTLDDPAATFASTQIQAPNQAPTADAGADQTVASEASVNLNGNGSTDPDGDPLDYSWTQTSGPGVTLSGANTATPSFTAPVGPATLTFDLEVCDAEPLCDTDSVTVNVDAPVIQVVDAGAELIVNGPTRSAATKKGFVVRVSNLGTGDLTIDPTTDVSAEVTVNGSPAGSVELKSTNSKTLSPGAKTRFRFQWNLEGSAVPGDTVVYSGTVSVTDDAMPGNDSDSSGPIIAR